MTTVLYPGSFDPVHNGHVEIIDVSAQLFDQVVVAVLRNPQKGQAMFDVEERVTMLRQSVDHLENVEVVGFAKLVVEVVVDVGADFIIKGLRAVSDFESEMHQAHMNLAISGVHTVFIPSATTHSFVASKLIREISRFGGDVTSMVPEPVVKRLAERFGP